ncbi:hypothetical protein LMG31884_42580 [Xanthomonas hydrangeae]|uniref:T6SS phospholipase effector Tle1-like catalytic domain-containing protein n=1 Tax=Xanthomonas hydrangeae TaxID=2775159 RepID=UPI001AF676EC|nr:hypothetical protein LMG31884_42580 [Xanthomonas hydrangeae]CAD7728707.1 hypothetical protein LMG31884_42580 [Xanthomonas hydrangeae]CAD7744287.1 hypothetical protein LMG31887_42500 [Xanthomonas hydrangeae]CAD7744290.1 hypothetical protein LMG31887_42500 [Xanthomonas hydrangeae]
MEKKPLPDGVTTYPADAKDLASYNNATQALSAQEVPILVDSAQPHSRLFIAAFDGTGNNLYKDAPEHRTNVAESYLQIDAARRKEGLENIGAGYVEGVGTQGGLGGTRDLMQGYTYEARLEEMYVKFAEQSAKWIREYPGAKISLAPIGFSRGAEQAAGFARLVHERGIQDPEGMVIKREANGLIEHIEFTKPPLVAPGQVAQAVGLFDPVGTGVPRDHDRRLPPSVISGFQITAEDERRNLFQSTAIMDAGRTEDGRFLNVTVGGAHSDIGGSYSQNGLAIRSGNVMVDYLNGLSAQPFLDKRAVPSAPEMNVVHRSEEHQFIYSTSLYDKSGARGVQTELAPPALCRIDCLDAQPVDKALAEKFTFKPVAIGPVPAEPHALKASQSTVPNDPLYQAIHSKLPAGTSDAIAMHATVEAKREGIVRADQLQSVTLQQGNVWIVGQTPGFRVKVDLSAPMPPLDESIRQSQALDEQRMRPTPDRTPSPAHTM